MSPIGYVFLAGCAVIVGACIYLLVDIFRSATRDYGQTAFRFERQSRRRR